jgi:tetratricopeptide (TPR) repeat protein
MFSPKLSQSSEDVVASTLSKIARIILVLVFGFLPILFIPSAYAPFNFSKVLIVIFALGFALIFFSLSALRAGEIRFKLNSSSLAIWGVVLAAFISASLSGDIVDSLVGDFFGIHTVVFLLVLATIIFSVTNFLSRKKDIINLYTLLISSGAVVGVYQIAKLIFGSSWLSLGVFPTLTSSPLGSWNDLALFFGLILLLIMVIVEHFSLSRLAQISLLSVSFLSLLILAVVNFFQIWVILSVSSLVVLMFSLSKNRSFDSQTNKTNIITSVVISLSIFVVSVMFVLGGSALGKVVSDTTNVSYIEVRPSMTATFDIVNSVYKENAFVGIGPNKFIDAWRLYKNPLINETVFWNNPFTAGFSYILTSVATIGILGIFAWLIFFTSFLYVGFRFLFIGRNEDRLWHFIGVSSFVASLYLWGITFIYVPGPMILILGAIFIGLVFASFNVTKVKKEISISIINNRQAGFVLTALTMIVIVVSVSALFLSGRQYSSLYNFNKTVVLAKSGLSIDTVESNILKSFDLSNNDRYLREVVGLQISKINALLILDEPTDVQRKQFEDILIQAISNAKLAVDIDPTDPQNWIVIADIYSILAKNNVEGAYDKARETYQNATIYDPTNPTIKLLSARLESQIGNLDGAKAEALKAIELKKNYKDAFLIVTQIDIARGDIEGAIKSAQASITLEPNNAARYYQLGVLQLTNEKVDLAVKSLQQAVSLDKNYSNARYYLAISYDQLGDTDKALEQLEIVRELNPDNPSVLQFIAKLEAGSEVDVETPVNLEESEVKEDSGQDVVYEMEDDSPLLTPVNTVPESDAN